MTERRPPFRVNGADVSVLGDPMRRLTEVLRDDLGLTGTKVGCDAGDCGACTVRLDGDPVCACLVPLGQLAGRDVATVEGLADGDRAPARPGRLPVRRRRAVRDLHPGHAHGVRRLARRPPASRPRSRSRTRSAASSAGAPGIARSSRRSGPRRRGRASRPMPRAPAAAVGARIARVDGVDQVTGATRFGADEAPAGALTLRVVRSPHAHARFAIGDLAGLRAAHPGLVRVLHRGRRPRREPLRHLRDGQGPAGARRRLRPLSRRGRRRAGRRRRDRRRGSTTRSSRSHWQPLPAAGRARRRRGSRARSSSTTVCPGNLLAAGRVVRGDVEAALAASAVVATGTFETVHVEHAYIEPEAGYAERHGDRIAVFASTQTPYMDRDEIALIMGFEPDRVQVIPSACGGGFGGKLDLSLQPLVAMAAWILDRPVRCVFTRPESMRATTKRHPARITASLGADADGRLTAIDFHGDFDTGAYASWGPTVANRVPVHASGPYVVPAVRATTRRHLHERPDRRRVPRVRRPAGGHRPGGAARRRRRPARDGPARDPPAQRPAGRVGDGDRPGPRRPAPGSRPASRRCGRPGTAPPPRPPPRTPRRSPTAPPIRRGVGHRGDVVRHRQHVAAQPVDRPDRPAPRRDVRAVQRRAGDRPGLEHGHDPDRRRRPGRPARHHRAGHRRHGPDAGFGQDLGLAPDVRLGQCHEARRRGPPAPDGGVRAGPGPASRGRDRLHPGRDRQLRPAHDARWTPTGRASRTRRTASAPRSPRSTWTSSSARPSSAGSWPPTTSVGPSTRCSSRARSTAGSRRAWGWR